MFVSTPETRTDQTVATMSTTSDEYFATNFEIPQEVKHDLVYCQQALANHICVHQKIAIAATQLNIPDFRAKKSLHQMEEEIMSIGAEQKAIFNRLRLFIDYFLLRNKVDRKQLTDYVSAQIAMYAKVCGPKIRPLSVKRRLSATELHNKFIANNSTAEGKFKLDTSDTDDTQIILLDDNDDDDDTQESNGTNVNDANMDGEMMEFMVSPEDIPGSIESNEQSNQQLQLKAQHKQESLLKPKAERISLPKERVAATATVTNETAHKPLISSQQKKSIPPQEAISLSRLKLKQALCKAKDEKKPVEEARIKSPSPDTVRFIPTESKPITILSSSSASSSSSEDCFETVDWSGENAGPTELSKEPFLRYFGLYTHPYSEYLIKKRSVRKRRMCTSTEHRDFHYGRLDLFEKQYANKRNKRQFLYSPPATRAKKQRRAASDAEIQQSVAIAEKSVTSQGTKSNASSSSSMSSSSNGGASSTASLAKVCVKCFKRNNLLECRICMGKYHAACHIGLASSSSLFDICPCCWRQQNRRQLQPRPTINQRKKALYAAYGRRQPIIRIN